MSCRYSALHSKIGFLRSAFLLIASLFLTFISSTAQQVQLLQLGVPLRGSTTDASPLVNLGSKYRAGQVLLKLNIPSLNTLSHQLQQSVKVTTCSPNTNFDTVLFAYDTNPLASTAGNASSSSIVSPLHVNDNDCDLQSTIETVLTPGAAFYILVTGYANQKGIFEIRAHLQTAHESTTLPWGLDRIDQRTLPLDQRYSVSSGGRGVFAYVLDSGIIVSHSEFTSPDGSRRALFGTDLVDRLHYPVDATGHGTHVAATIGGNYFGVAKQVTIISVRVLNRRNIGYTTRLIEGLDWSLSDIGANSRRPAVVVMSLSTPFSRALNEAVERVTDAGISVVTAAGNSKFDSCSFSPASASSAITVASINRDDSRSDFSNFGECIDIYAPGQDILSAWHTGNHAVRNRSGTSAACPHVAGTVAVLLGDNPGLQAADVSSVVYSTATHLAIQNHILHASGTVTETTAQFDPRNRLVFVRPVPNLVHTVSPESGTMFIYAVFVIEDSQGEPHCELSSESRQQARDVVRTASSTKEASPTVTTFVCCPGKQDEGCVNDPESNSTSLVFQLAIPDVHASATFKAWRKYCLSSDSLHSLKQVISGEVRLLYEPWVVDSRGYKYWAAPSLIHTDRSSISTSQAIIVACMTCLAVVFVALAVACFVQRRKEQAQQMEKAEYDRKAEEFARTQERASNLTNVDNGVGMEYRREGMKRINTELIGDVLKNITSSAALITPRFFGGRTPRTRERAGEQRTPRTQSGAHESISGGAAGSAAAHRNTRAFGAGSPQSSAFKSRKLAAFTSFFGGLAVTPRGRDQATRSPLAREGASGFRRGRNCQSDLATVSPADGESGETDGGGDDKDALP